MRCVTVLVCMGVWFVTLTVGQEKPEPPKRNVEIPVDTTRQEEESPTREETLPTQEETLPKVEVPEYQIIGKETPQVKEGAKTDVDDQRVYDLSIQPMTTGQREASNVNLRDLRKPENGFEQQMKGFSGKLVIGYGSYTTPMFNGWTGVASGSANVLLRAGYESTIGLFPNQDSRNGFAALSGGVFLPESVGLFSNGRFRGNVGFQGESYKLHGSLTPARIRTLTRFNGDVWLTMEYKDGGFLTSALHINNASVVDSARSGENYAGFEMAGGKTIGRTRLKAEMSLWRNFYASPTTKNDPYFSNLGFSAYYQASDDVELFGGAAFFAARGSALNSCSVIYPKLGIQWHAKKGFSVFAKYEPYVQRNSLSSFAESNPYLHNDVHIQNTEYFNSLSIGTEIDASKTVKAKVSVNYKRVRYYPIFVETPENLWSISYTGATRIVSFESVVYADITTDDNLAVMFTVQNSSLRDVLSGSGKEIPYFPHIVLSALYQHRFHFGMTFTSSMKYVDRRSADVSNSQTLPSFVLWDVKAEQKLFQRLTIGLALENILDQQLSWWENYVGQPRRVMLSAGFTW